MQGALTDAGKPANGECHASSVQTRLMAAALRLGARSEGLAWPNPAVGALVVRFRDGEPEIVGRGATAPGGRPHAEAVALREAGTRAAGATCIVTLEPCAQQGRGGPCAEALIDAGVACVVAAIEDPNTGINGAGFRRLERAGVAVRTGILADRARYAHRGHCMRVTRGRPFVTLKLARDGNGFIGVRGAGPVAITGAQARRAVHLMRARTDAIAVGIGTVVADDPALTCRLPGLMERSPVRVIFDARAAIAMDTKLVASATRTPLWLIVGPQAPADKRAALTSAGVVMIECPCDRNGRLVPGDALGALARRGITRLMLEGGARLAQAFHRDGLIDEAVLLRAPAPIAASVQGERVPAFAPQSGKGLLSDGDFCRLERRMIGVDELTRYIRKKALEPFSF